MDEIDRKIISLLKENGRMTFKDLGIAIGFTSAGAKKRVESLLKTGLIQVSALLDFEKLNLKAGLILFEIESESKIREFLERFRKCPRVVSTLTVIGKYNLIALLIAEDQKTFESILLGKCALRGEDARTHIEVFPLASQELHLPISLELRQEDVSPCGVRCTTCGRYRDQYCVGCPSTECYRGELFTSK
ncbi:MAG: winged helix-turn-helix transcriptional regulator [Promethearchaeota archaeon]